MLATKSRRDILSPSTSMPVWTKLAYLRVNLHKRFPITEYKTGSERTEYFFHFQFQFQSRPILTGIHAGNGARAVVDPATPGVIDTRDFNDCLVVDRCHRITCHSVSSRHSSFNNKHGCRCKSADRTALPGIEMHNVG